MYIYSKKKSKVVEKKIVAILPSFAFIGAASRCFQRCYAAALYNVPPPPPTSTSTPPLRLHKNSFEGNLIASTCSRQDFPAHQKLLGNFSFPPIKR